MNKITYVFKNTKLYGYIKGDDLFLLDGEDEKYPQYLKKLSHNFNQTHIDDFEKTYAII